MAAPLDSPSYTKVICVVYNEVFDMLQLMALDDDVAFLSTSFLMLRGDIDGCNHFSRYKDIFFHLIFLTARQSISK